jgi:hypothetical protein
MPEPPLQERLEDYRDVGVEVVGNAECWLTVLLSHFSSDVTPAQRCRFPG